MEETLITPSGLERLTEELERLRTAGRREIADRIRAAVATDADPSGNADYHGAREEQAQLEARIARLEQRLEAVRVVEPDAGNDVVEVGERVLLRDLDTDARLEFELVGSLEVDPAAGRISAVSPLGRAVVGRRLGEIALVEAPRGRRRLRIDGIELAAAAV